MSEPNSTASGTGRGKLDDDDHDLLTFVEVSERLSMEIRAAEFRVSELEAAGGDALQAARTRLSALRAAAQRNAASSINDENFEKFFGYPGKARRNVTSPQPDP